MPEPQQNQRIQISTRLKAARQLAGEAVGQKVRPLPVPVLATFPELVKNNVTRNRLEEIEQMKVDARPYELVVLSDALNLPPGWWGIDVGERDAELSELVGGLLHAVAEAVQERRTAREAPDEAPDAAHRPRGATGGDTG